MAAIKAAFPPPITATDYPANKGASQIVQKLIPLPSNSSAPGTLIFFGIFPLAIIIALASKFSPLSVLMEKFLFFLSIYRQADLLEWFKKLQNRYHSPIDFKRYELCITNGSMEGLSKVFELVLNSSEPILVDSPCYSGSLDCVRHCYK